MKMRDYGNYIEVFLNDDMPGRYLILNEYYFFSESLHRDIKVVTEFIAYPSQPGDDTIKIQEINNKAFLTEFNKFKKTIK